MGKTGSRTTGKQKQVATKTKASVKAKARAVRAKPAVKARGAKVKPSGRKAAAAKPPTPKSKAKPRLSLVPPPRPAKLAKVAQKSKRSQQTDPVTKPNGMRSEPMAVPAKRTKPQTQAERRQAAYDSEVLAVLREELGSDGAAGTDAEIRRRLREKALGSYDAARVAALRRFKAELQSELASGPQSGHFTSPHGLYANPEDFDHARLIRDYTRAYPSLSPEAIAGFVPLAVYFYYLR
jgi:hypothetical protein